MAGWHKLHDLWKRLAALRKFLELHVRHGYRSLAPRRRSDGDERVPLTSIQHIFWSGQKLHPSSAAYIMTAPAHFRGVIDVAKLEAAVSAVVHRHEILRTVFIEDEGTPIQRVCEPFPFQVDVCDLRGRPDPEQEADYERVVLAHQTRAVDLSILPLFEIVLFRLADDDFRLYLKLHHLISDGYSLTRLVDEISRAYNGERLALPPLQYADYAMWERRVGEKRFRQADLAFWRTSYLDEVQPFDLALARKPVQERRSNRAASMHYVLPRTLCADLRKLSRRLDVTQNEVLLSAFLILLSRHTQRERLSLGFPRADRRHPAAAPIFGPMLNTLVLAPELDGAQTFARFAASLKQELARLYEHESIPYHELLKRLRPRYLKNRNPYFDVMFNYVASRLRPYWRLAGSTEVFTDYRVDESELVLTWYVFGDEANGVLHVITKFLTEILDAEAVAIMSRQYHALLEQVVADPDRPLGSYGLTYREDLDEGSRAYFEDPARDLGHYHSVGARPRLPPADTADLREVPFPDVLALIAGHAAAQPDHPAVEAPGRVFTYGELWSTAQAITSRLRAAGAKPGDVVALHGEHGFVLYATALAVWMSGGAVLMIDRTQPLAHKQSLLGLAHARYVVSADAADELAPARERLVVIAPNVVLRPAASEPLPVFPPHASDTPAYIFFTSGTTGTPKGIIGSRKGLAHFLTWQRTRFAIGPHDRCAQATNLGFDVVLREVFTPLTAGAVLCVPGKDAGIESGRFLEWLDANRISFVHLVPTLGGFLLQSGAAPYLKHLRVLFFAGEPLSDRLVTQWREQCAAEIVNLYGPTETTLAKAFFVVPREPVPGVQPIGQPLPQTQITIKSAGGHPCGVGEIGEIHITTPYRTLGYINANAAECARFAEDGSYRTGDLGFRDVEGRLHIRGRSDDQIKLNGIRVSAQDLSAAILKVTPEAAQCVVVPWTNAGGAQSLVAYVVARQPPAGLQESIIGRVRQRYPRHMVPGVIILLDELPRTPRGKVDHRRLPLPAVPGSTAGVVGATRAPSATEAKVVRIAGAILGRPIADVDGDLFDQGLGSLDGVRLVVQLNQALGVRLTFADVLAAPTAAGLARVIDDGAAGGRADRGKRMTIAELRRRVELPAAVQVPRPAAAGGRHAGTIFITGATGFLGAFLCADLLARLPAARFVCLVRARDEAAGHERLRATFRGYGLATEELTPRRVEVLAGDLTTPRFGLSPARFAALGGQVEVIYHSGAQVSFVADFAQLESANIDGSRTILELAVAGGATPVHYVSTAGIFPVSARLAATVIGDDDLPEEPGDVLVGGYAQTKYVADRIMLAARARGLPVTVFRPGRISGDSRSGAWQDDDAVRRFLHGCAELGAFPDLSVGFDFNPVDLVAGAIARISLTPEQQNRTFNIVTPHQLSVAEIAGHLRRGGVHVDIVAYPVWRARLQAAIAAGARNPLTPLLELFTEDLEEVPRLKYNRAFDCRNLRDALGAESELFSPPDAMLLARYLPGARPDSVAS